MSTLSDKLSDIGQAWETLFVAAKSDLGLKIVWYGGDESQPETPALLINPETKERTIQETGLTTINEFTVFLTILHSRLDTQQVTRKECDAMAEAIEAFMHDPDNAKLGGLVYFGYVRRMQHGIATRQRAFMRATRLTWIGRSKTRIGQ